MLVCHSLWKTINIVKKVNHFFFALKNRSIYLKMIITFLSLSFYGCLCFLLYRLNFNRIVSIYDYKSNSSDDNKIYSKKIKTKKKMNSNCLLHQQMLNSNIFFPLLSTLYYSHYLFKLLWIFSFCVRVREFQFMFFFFFFYSVYSHSWNCHFNLKYTSREYFENSIGVKKN